MRIHTKSTSKIKPVSSKTLSKKEQLEEKVHKHAFAAVGRDIKSLGLTSSQAKRVYAKHKKNYRNQLIREAREDKIVNISNFFTKGAQWSKKPKKQISRHHQTLGISRFDTYNKKDFNIENVKNVQIDKSNISEFVLEKAKSVALNLALKNTKILISAGSGYDQFRIAFHGVKITFYAVKVMNGYRKFILFYLENEKFYFKESTEYIKDIINDSRELKRSIEELSKALTASQQ